MTTPTLLIIATLLPLVSFTILVFLGKRMGTPLAGWVATAFIAGSAACSMAALITWITPTDSAAEVVRVEPGQDRVRVAILQPLVRNWLPITDATIPISVYVDSVTIAMFAMVTTVSTLIFIFSLGYMREDKRFPQFFTYLSLFCFSMLGLVLGGTLLQLFIFWELVGLCSYLLIGFWYEKKSASNAAIKAFVTNRIGDFGFLIGLGILFYHLGNVSLPDVWRILDVSKMTADGITLGTGATISVGLLTVMGIGLFFGAVGKSAQFPLHVWLPDAMEGPTPVSALIHAATMVAAGVYLVGRIFPILTPDARLFIAIIGLVTLTMAAMIALVQSDIKKVLAYSTLSQLGFMVLAMGVGSWVGGLFHLITHAFFKALLFLGSGSVINAAHHEQELSQYGGLIRKIPVTAITFGIAVLAIAGTPFLSGYYSKDMLLAHAGAFSWMAIHDGRSGAYWAFFILPTIVAYVTAFYMMRCWMLTFWGKPRNQHLYDHAREHPVMYLPLVALAILSIIGGRFLGVQEMLSEAPQQATALCRQVDPSFAGFEKQWPADLPQRPEHDAALEAFKQGHHLVGTYVFWAFVVGIGLGFVMYVRGYAVANVLMRIPPLRWIHTWLYRRMYFDELYRIMFVSATLAISSASGWFDKYIVDGLVNAAGWVVRRLSDLSGLSDKYVVDGAVNGVADLTAGLGAVARAPQTGRIRFYVTVVLIALTLGVAIAVGATLWLVSASG